MHRDQIQMLICLGDIIGVALAHKLHRLTSTSALVAALLREIWVGWEWASYLL